MKNRAFNHRGPPAKRDSNPLRKSKNRRPTKGLTWKCEKNQTTHQRRFHRGPARLSPHLLVGISSSGWISTRSFFVLMLGFGIWSGGVLPPHLAL